MSDDLKKVPARFYRTASGAEPVRAWLLTLDRNDRRKIGADIATVEYGWPIGMPTCRAMGSGLWEVRTDLEGNRTSRVLFCLVNAQLVLLHGFVKKSRTTPKADLDLAKRRMKEVVR